MVGQNSAGARGVPFWGRGFELLLSGDVRLAWGLLLLSWGIVLVAAVTGHGHWLHADPLTEHPSWPLGVNLITREFLSRDAHFRSCMRDKRAAPSDPAKWCLRSLQSMHGRQKVRRCRAAASVSIPKRLNHSTPDALNLNSSPDIAKAPCRSSAS